MIDTINHHMTAFWLQALHQIAATRNSLRATGSIEPPEIERLHRTAVRNFAHSSIGRTFYNYEKACNWAADIAQISGRTITVTRLTKTDFRSQQTTELVVYADDQIPHGPGYVTVDILTRFTSIPKANDGS